MRRKLIICFVSILCVFLMATLGAAQEAIKKFTLKISGGYGSISGGDLTTVANGLNEMLADIARLAGASVLDEIENAKWGPEFEGEFGYNITERFGIGLSVGYIRKSVESRAELQIGTFAQASIEWEPMYKVVPINLSGYYNLPIASKMNAFLKAGVGYYFAIWDYKIHQENELGGITILEEKEGTANDSGFGFLGGFGLEYSVSDSVALFLDGTGRSVNLKDWDIDNTHRDSFGSDTEKGDLWYVEEYEEDTGKYYPNLEVFKDEPSDPNLQNVRKAEISLSGFVFRVGVKFRF